MNPSRTIAIQPDHQKLENPESNSSSWHWSRLAAQYGYDVRLVDVRNDDIMEQLKDCHAFMWRHRHIYEDHIIARRLMPAIESGLGIPVYPDHPTAWHFDEKIAQKYLLEALGLPAPRTHLFWNRKSAEKFAGTATYPLVAKLTGGASAANVMLLKNVDEALNYIRRMFTSGAFSLNDDWGMETLSLGQRLRAARKLLTRGVHATHRKAPSLQTGYVLLQEFLPDNAFDTRVNIIGNRAFAFRRFNRPDDFRASGSGNMSLDPQAIDPAMLRLAFRVSLAVGMQCLAMDGLYRNGQPVIGEIGYTFISSTVHECPGHWELCGSPEDGTLNWVEGQMWPEEAQFADFHARIQQHYTDD